MKKQTALFILALLSICSVHAFAANDDSRRGERRQRQPPPEAYTACEGKKSGDTAELTGPRGDTVTGTCVQEKDGDRLFLRPDKPPKGERPRRQEGGEDNGPRR
ncbi:MAG: hypothetical protein Q3M24_15260 [Candidatus Electrothrix aestuarii]|uniref:DUF5666 domain-containing protein n=1 Tax=Candidatus Electrothrix aestuarii TaxID=3062594 RepID=A0AAU8LQT8_9BACT|nr:hypothetical protein [Candidatus Electrothrix aestuarii]WPD21818.1 MAG: hypothetical protein SD837_16610 [Candidatus Electrothrix sp. GW3-3]